MTDLVRQGLAVQALNLQAEERLAREAEFDRWMAGLEPAGGEWARLADDSFCQCCGRRGVVGPFCAACERS